MTSTDLREKYLDFFAARGHAVIPSSPLVPENDPTTLFTSSGMQPLVPYLLGEPHPSGKRLVNVQKSFRSQDIDEVGDNRHTTFFEMLGNWSLGDYFKEEQLAWFWEFLTKELGLPKERLWVSVFEGNTDIPRDDESAKIWKSLGLPEGKIFYYGIEKNWWSRSGVPSNMPSGEPGGPDSEVFFEFIQTEHDSKYGRVCHPNCDCGRFMEVGNSVFMQYQKQSDGTFSELPQKNVDFGGGLERLTAAVNDNPDIFYTDSLLEIIQKLEALSGKSYAKFPQPMRISADHLRAAIAISEEGVVPGNKGAAYILRRLLRRTSLKMKDLGIENRSEATLRITSNETIASEMAKFDKTLERGLREFQKYSNIDGKTAFDLYQTYGFPLELTLELASKKGFKLNEAEFASEFEKHQNLSRTSSEGMFKGGLADKSEAVIKYHTATHLLHKALRNILGDHVSQSGSNITSERLRFDFTHPGKMTPEEISQVENEVNQKITENLPVSREEMPKNKALTEGALAFFPEKYPEVTSVYTIGGSNWYSKELCGGPHVNSTGEIGHIKIIREESAGSGIRRLYAQLA